MDLVWSIILEYAKMTDCPICYESINQTTGCCVLSCSHSFHIKCLTKWTTDASTCPMCRHALSDIELNRPDPPQKVEITRSDSSWFRIAPYTFTTEDRITQVIHEAGVTRNRAIHELRDSAGNVDEAILMARDSHRYIPSTPPPPRNPMEPTDDMLTAWALERLFRYGTVIDDTYDYGSLADTIQRTNVTRFSGHASSLWMNTDFVGSEVRERSLSI
jgi:hypothetical protein